MAEIKTIGSQRDASVSDLPYGKLRKPVARVGCGAVALYNARLFLGIPTAFESLLREMEGLKMPWLSARFGTKPLSLRRYFRTNNIPFRNYFCLERFWGSLTEGNIGIVCAWNRGFHGIHFYCVYRKDRRLWSLNYVDAAAAQPFDPGCLSPMRFIVGYVL